MKNWVFIAMAAVFFLSSHAVIAQVVELDENQAPGRNMAIQAVKEKQIWITTDHSMHEILQKQFVRFATPQRCAAIAEHTVAPGKEKNLKKVPSRLWRY